MTTQNYDHLSVKGGGLKTKKMKRDIRNSFLFFMLIMIALIGCKKDDVNYENDGKGEGLLKINGNEYLITESSMFVGTLTNYSSFWGRYLFFYTEKEEMTVQITMTNNELTTGTYTNEGKYIDIVLGIAINNEGFDIDIDNIVMVVNKSGKTYEIKISGKTKYKEYEYTVYYKGTIREEK